MALLKKILRKYRFLHYLGLHNKDCSRRVYTTNRDYICIVTGKKHKKLKL